MVEPLDEQYLKWLYSQVASVRLRNPARTYWSLARALFRKEYIWFVPNDDNRVEDGRDLRREFLSECEIDVDLEWLGIGCSMLEMLIGLSRRLSFEAEGEPRGWFWVLISNLDLQEHSDLHFNASQSIDDILDAVIWRTYEPSGRGGLFPLREPGHDQTQVEVWYQLSEYLLENS